MYISKMKRKLLIQFIYIELNKWLFDAGSNHKAQHYVIQNVYNVIYFLHPRALVSTTNYPNTLFLYTLLNAFGRAFTTN